jgi:carboxymethylenebutenolidase
MIEEILDIMTVDGAMETFICRPERDAPHPAVLILMDAPGIREELYEMVRRLATVGYCVILPNLYYRAGQDSKFNANVLVEGSDEHTRMRAIRANMTIPQAMKDVGDLLAFIDGRDEIRPGPIGTHGYCMSGPFSLAAAARYPDRIAAAASYYGTWLINDVEESPHLTFSQTKGELYIACAEYDHLAPLGMVEKLKGYLDKSGATGEIEIYPDVQHGFAFPERSVYDKLAAEQHWERMISLYRRTLG